MDTLTKDRIDITLAVLTMIGAVIAFIVSMRHWKRGQAWHRAEQLDKFIQKFETDELLKLSTVVLDWTRRDVKFQGSDFHLSNTEALLALRDHRTIEDENKFPGQQPHIRDAYDALLAFFNRLELALATNLIDVAPAKAYFGYWVLRLVTLDQHPDEKKILDKVTPQQIVARYIQLYGDEKSMTKLCEQFGIGAPVFEKV